MMSKCSWKINAPGLVVCALSLALSVCVPAQGQEQENAIPSKPAETGQDAGLNHYRKMTDLTPENPEVKQFIDQMVKTEQLDRNWLNEVFSKITYQPKVIALIEKPAEKRLTWGQYRAIFMKPGTIRQGVEFWQKNHAALSKAQKDYGVTPAVIVGILGVETKFGRITGGYKAIEALATLSFGYPPREKFFRKELEKYLILSRKESMDPMELTGSYAGALGMAQFMPSSYLAYAVDFTRNGQADIWNSPADAIGSIANYLKKHDWQRGQKIAVPALPEADSDYEKILSTSSMPTLTLKEANEKGLKNTRWLPSTAMVRGLKLEGVRGPEYWLTTRNFYSITRYNRSDLYAMAVFQLGSAIERGYHDSVLADGKKSGIRTPAPMEKRSNASSASSS